MIKAVSITNYRSEKKTIVLADPWSTGVAITSISGLGPVKAFINMTEIAAMDGARYNSARIPSRNIVINFALDYYPTIEHARNELYRLFPVKHNVALEIETDIHLYRTSGYVEYVDPNIFSSQEIVAVSILCPSPFFEAIDNAEEFSGILSFDHSFEFPFSNENPYSPVIEFGNPNKYVDFAINYRGYAQTGLTFHIFTLSDGIQNGWVSITRTDTNQSVSIDISKISNGLSAGDEIIICTVSGSKYVKLKHNGVMTNILNSATIQNQWIIVDHGNNNFRFEVNDLTVASWMIKFNYSPLFEGI